MKIQILSRLSDFFISFALFYFCVFYIHVKDCFVCVVSYFLQLNVLYELKKANDITMADPSSVKVAVRVRPLVAHEVSKGSKEIVETITENDQIVIKTSDKAFTFNYVISATTSQAEFYNRCVAPLLKNLFHGFNVTIFAYGQTGSGKTHSMGTTFRGDGDSDNMGVIPRAINEIFETIRDQFAVEFSISVSFTELYREVLYDLLADKPRDQCVLEIREDNRGIYIPNQVEVPVNSASEVLNILMKGSQGRATASTNMNSHSSRSHSIFSINIAMQNKEDKTQNKTARLHLVDLAGSERPKKTGAQGTTFKEGVDINKGLFVLGNVISALGDEKTQNGFIPYRDSNLTRLLKDSLGGNSVTLMIACISPADYNLEETLSTLRYADRARRIKNKPIVNQDPKTAEINQLKKQVKLLQLQLVGESGSAMSSTELDGLKTEVKELNLKIKELRVQLSAVLLEKTGLHEKVQILESANKTLATQLHKLKSDCDETFSRISEGVERNDFTFVKENLEKLNQIKDHFNILREEQLKAESEIKTHEETFGELLLNSGQRSFTASKELEEKAAFHTDRQMVLNTQFEEVTKQLALKENLAAQLAINTQNMIDYQIMRDTESKIEVLEKEKTDLLHQLRSIKSQENTGKIAEQRRKRVQELEKHLEDLKKKVVEQSRLLKLKEKDEQKMKQLNQEILNMKSTKVKLLKEMKTESVRFKTWKQMHERELAKVTQQDRKKATEMAKMKAAHEKQKNVLKRKFDEAAALNKRLQNTLMKRKEAQNMRFTGKVEKVAAWLKEELEIHLNLIEAEATLSGLLEDRATLQGQLEELKNNPETVDSPEIKGIEEDLDLRSVQIQDLQQKLLDSREDDKSKTRFDTVQTMVEAKFALAALFEQAAEHQKKQVQTRRELTDLKESQKELQDKIEHLTRQVATAEDRYNEKLAQEQQTHQEKMGILLAQARDLGDGAGVDPENQLAQRCKLQLEQIEYQKLKIDDQEKQIQELQIRLKEIAEAAKSSQEFPKPVKPLKSKKECPNPTILVSNGTDEESDLSLVEETDDPYKDPDWRNTPIAKRLKTFKNETLGLVPPISTSNGPPTEVSINSKGSKRSSGGGCTCKRCNTQRCKCRKLSKACSESCRCNHAECENKLCTSTDVSRENIHAKDSDSDQETTTTPEKKAKLSHVNDQPRGSLKQKKIYFS